MKINLINKATKHEHYFTSLRLCREWWDITEEALDEFLQHKSTLNKYYDFELFE